VCGLTLIVVNLPISLLAKVTVPYRDMNIGDMPFGWKESFSTIAAPVTIRHGFVIDDEG